MALSWERNHQHVRWCVAALNRHGWLVGLRWNIGRFGKGNNGQWGNGN